MFDEAWIKLPLRSLTILVERPYYSKELASNRFYDNYSLKYVFVTKFNCIALTFLFFVVDIFWNFSAYSIMKVLTCKLKMKGKKKEIMKVMKWHILKIKLFVTKTLLVACIYLTATNACVCFFIILLARDKFLRVFRY